MLPHYKSVWSEEENLGKNVCKPISSWSSQNWIAFTIGHIWKQPSPNKIDTVFICNPDQPWELYTLQTNHGCAIVHLQWEGNGMVFITVDSKGIGKIWHPDKNLVNNWTCSSTIDIGEGDKIRCFSWINSRSKYSIDVEKLFLTKDFFKKFSQTKNENALNSIAHGQNGFIIVTSSGLFKIFLLQDDNEPAIFTTRLGSIKFNVLHADICVNENGKVCIAALTDQCMVELFSVTCKENATGLELSVDVSPCIVPHVGSNDQDFINFKIVDIKYISIGSSDQVLVLSKSKSASCVQVFEIKKEQVMLHPCFPRGQSSQQCADTCVCLKTFRFQHNIKSMFVTNLRYSNLGKSKDLSLSPKLVMLDEGGGFHVYSLYNWSQVVKLSTVQLLQTNHITCASFSPCDHCLFAVLNNGDIMLFTLPHYSICQDKIKVKNLVNLLQYSMVEGCIPWDVMMYFSSVEKNILDQSFQTFLDDYNECNAFLQDLFNNCFWNVKIMFYRLYKDYCGVVESCNIMLLHNLYYYVVSRLQTDKESVLMDTIHKICSSNKEADVSKILPLIDMKDTNIFLCSDTTQRPLVQWVTDYALHFVRLILSKNHHGQNWRLALKYFDPTCFLHLRQLLLLFHIIYQKNFKLPHVHPVFMTMASSSEITAQLFKLVTKLHQISTGEAGTEVGMNDLPFSNLPVLYLEFPSHDPKSSILSSLNVTSNKIDEYELQLQSDPWEYIHKTALENPLSMGISTVNTWLRQIYDGINFMPSSLMLSEVVKQCCNCGCLTIHSGHSSRVFNTLWKACWERKCFCGGWWKQVEWHT